MFIYLATDALHPRSSIRPDRMKSILVKTGVYGSEHSVLDQEVNHLHRDTVLRPELRVPTHICDDVLQSVNKILEEEQIT